MREEAVVTSDDRTLFVERLVGATNGMDVQERESLLTLMGVIVSALRPPAAGGGPISETQRAALRVIRDLRHPAGAPSNGVIFHGRPPWMSDGLLEELRIEVTARRETARRNGLHWFARGGERAHALAASTELHDFVRSLVGPITPTIKANVNYYERPGDAVEPHYDRDEFGLNALIMLRHDHTGNPKSDLYVYPADGAPERIALQLGEVILFHAGSTVHQRTAVGSAERVETCSIGFIPGA